MVTCCKTVRDTTNKKKYYFRAVGIFQRLFYFYNMKNSIIKSYLVELNFATAPAAQTRVNFVDQPQLREKRIVGIEAISASQLSFSPTGKNMVTQANCLSTGLTLKEGTTDIIYQIPFAQMVTQNNGGLVREFFGIVVNFQSSGIDVFSATVTANYSICYNFLYVDKENWNEYVQLRKANGRFF